MTPIRVVRLQRVNDYLHGAFESKVVDSSLILVMIYESVRKSHIQVTEMKLNVKVKHSHYRPGQAQRFPRS